MMSGCARRDSNPQSLAPEATALSIKLRALACHAGPAGWRDNSVRWGQDSNSRRAFTLVGFRNRAVRPLRHPTSFIGAPERNRTSNHLIRNQAFCPLNYERASCLRCLSNVNNFLIPSLFIITKE